VSIRFLVVFCVVFLVMQHSNLVVAQEMAGLQIPLIERPPSLDDFSGMQPSSELESMMVKVDGFIQREQ
jgi:hypothetical protein